MPRISVSASISKNSATITCETTDVATAAPVVSRTTKSFGFGEGVCTCARCMRRAGPIREDVEERIVQIAYVLAGVYMDTPNPEEHVKEHHRLQAQEFMTLVEEGNVAALRSMFDSVSSGEDTVVEEIATELIISAAQLGQADVIKLLKDKGADVEEKDLRRGGRPLMHASNNGHTAAVKSLIDGGADTEARDDNGYTALMVSIFSDRSSAAEALLAAGAKVDSVDEKGRTALSYAAMYGSTDCIYLLSNHSANVFHADKEGNTPLELAEDSGRTGAVEALRKLQMKHRMQERRKHRQKGQGCTAMNEDELARKEAEAAAHAQQLLLELEQEEQRKVTKSAKKAKKKNKLRAHEEELSSTGGSGEASQCQTPSLPDTAVSDSRGAQQGSTPSPHKHPSGPDPVKSHPLASSTSSPGSPAAPATPPQEESGLDSASWLDGIVLNKYMVDSSGQENGGSGRHLEVDVEALRQRWESVLDEAAKCLDERRQAALLTAVEALLPLCADSGISVKYGRKVLQRLQAVAPARAALKAAVAEKPVVRSKLDATLREAKLARSLLPPALLAEAEALLERVKQEEQEATWNSLASSLSWDSKRLSGSPSTGSSPLAAHNGANGAVFERVSSLVSQQVLFEGEGEDIDEELECVVCLNAVKSVCCIPCGHACMCRTCADGVRTSSNVCPVCRSEIQCVIEFLEE